MKSNNETSCRERGQREEQEEGGSEGGMGRSAVAALDCVSSHDKKDLGVKLKLNVQVIFIYLFFFFYVLSKPAEIICGWKYFCWNI